jgi:hypothetical protein
MGKTRIPIVLAMIGWFVVSCSVKEPMVQTPVAESVRVETVGFCDAEKTAAMREQGLSELWIWVECTPEVPDEVADQIRGCCMKKGSNRPIKSLMANPALVEQRLNAMKLQEMPKELAEQLRGCCVHGQQHQMHQFIEHDRSLVGR